MLEGILVTQASQFLWKWKNVSEKFSIVFSHVLYIYMLCVCISVYIKSAMLPFIFSFPWKKEQRISLETSLLWNFKKFRVKEKYTFVLETYFLRD